jgi:hypothetical protein
MLKDTNPKDAVGVRKWRQYCTVPITVVWELGVAMLEGARKYGRHNYRVAGVRASVYVDAAKGHIDSWWEGEDIDSDSGLSHITKAMASLAVLRDAMINDMVTDDRPPKVCNFDAFKADMQQAVEAIMDRHPDAREPFTELGERSKDVLTGTLTGVADTNVSAPGLAGRVGDAEWVDDASGWNAGEADFVDLADHRRYCLRKGMGLPTIPIAHEVDGVRFVHPDHPEFGRLHVFEGLTTKQLCNLIRAAAEPGSGCGMNHASATDNLAIARPDIFDPLARKVIAHARANEPQEIELRWAHSFATRRSRVSAADWKIAIPDLVSAYAKPYHGAMAPRGSSGGGTGC